MSIKPSDDQAPLVTVALAVFNGGVVLEHAIRSVLNQTCSSWELLLIDDGSTDGAIARLPFLSDPRIIVVRDGCNRGLSVRLNQAVRMARGKYFARMDHDDLCHPERFAYQIAYLNSHPEVDLLATRCLTMGEKEQILGTLPSALEHASICRRPWLGFPMPHPTWMGRTGWFLRHPYPDPAPYCCEDQELLLRAYRHSCYHTLPECLLAYRVRSYTPWRKLWRTRLAMLKMQSGYFLSLGQWGYAAFSIAAAIGRVARDVSRMLGFYLSPSGNDRQGNMAPLDERLRWECLIKELKSATGTTGMARIQISKFEQEASGGVCSRGRP